MRLARALEEKQLDTRLRDKLLAEGKLSKDTLADYTSGLPDDTANCQTEDDSDSKES